MSKYSFTVSEVVVRYNVLENRNTSCSSTAKKLVVQALNRGLSSSKNLFLVEWCISMLRLERFFKDRPSLRRLEAMGVEPLLGIPTPVPTAGIPSNLKSSCVHRGFVAVLPHGGIPDFPLFWMARAASVV